MDNLKPSQIAILASGAVLFVFSFMDFTSGDFVKSENAWSDFGLTTFPAIFGLAAAGATAAVVFGNVELPDNLLGYSVNQILTILGLTSVLITVGMFLALPEGVDSGIGLIFSALGSIGLLVGTVMEQMASPSAGNAPTQPPAPF